MATETLDELIFRIRTRLTDLLASGAATRDTALLLADLEEEHGRREQMDQRLVARADALDTPRDGVTAGTSPVLDRPLPARLDDRAGIPRTHRAPNDEERSRGVAIAYANANPTFYRALIERLLPGEKFRLETQHGTFEMTREEFEMALPAMVRSASYQRGTDGAPGAARYVTGRVPQTIERFRVT
jgi:hypothetical protein